MIAGLLVAVATMGALALVAHAIVPGLPWAAAIALGAIVSPTDPLAAGLVMRRLGASRRLVSNAGRGPVQRRHGADGVPDGGGDLEESRLEI